MFGINAVFTGVNTCGFARYSPRAKVAAYETDDYKQTTPFAATLRDAKSEKILITLVAQPDTRNVF